METEKKFKTKTGFCHILPDKIVLTRDGFIGNVANVTTGNNMGFLILRQVAMMMLFAFFTLDSYEKGNTVFPILLGVITLSLVYAIVTSLNNSAASCIDRDKIKEVTFKKSIKGLTRSRFEIMFEDPKGNVKKRLIMLPGSLTGGDTESEVAVKIFEEEGLIN